MYFWPFRGLFITVHDKGHIYEVLCNWPEHDIKVRLLIRCNYVVTLYAWGKICVLKACCCVGWIAVSAYTLGHPSKSSIFSIFCEAPISLPPPCTIYNCTPWLIQVKITPIFIVIDIIHVYQAVSTLIHASIEEE